MNVSVRLPNFKLVCNLSKNVRDKSQEEFYIRYDETYNTYDKTIFLIMLLYEKIYNAQLKSCLKEWSAFVFSRMKGITCTSPNRALQTNLST